ncbi:hypothetical protein [Bacillus safensis]|nr:hypothetical protein [Bacillus safensis]
MKNVSQMKFLLLRGEIAGYKLRLMSIFAIVLLDERINIRT